MLVHKSGFFGPLKQLRIGKGFVKWVASTRLLGVTLDHRLSWVKHLTDLRKMYASKLALLTRMKFLLRDTLEILHQSYIAISAVWTNSMEL